MWWIVEVLRHKHEKSRVALFLAGTVCPFLVKHQYIGDLDHDYKSQEPKHSVIFVFLSNLEVSPYKCPYPNQKLLPTSLYICILYQSCWPNFGSYIQCLKVQSGLGH